MGKYATVFEVIVGAMLDSIPANAGKETDAVALTQIEEALERKL
ncbi:unnamed protein product [Acidithrix sp. C25]|nr:unnamed protein product [Acidithrix sp. C25]